MNEIHHYSIENSPEVECLQKLDQLEKNTQDNLRHIEEQFVLNQLEETNSLWLSICVDRTLQDFPKYYITKDHFVLNIPIDKVENLLQLSQVIHDWAQRKNPLYLDGKFHFRVIAENNTWGDYERSFLGFKDDILVKHTDTETSRLERKNEIEYENNKIEEIFKFLQNIRQNPKDWVEERVIVNNQIGFSNSPVTEQIAKMQEEKSKKKMVASK